MAALVDYTDSEHSSDDDDDDIDNKQTTKHPSTETKYDSNLLKHTQSNTLKRSLKATKDAHDDNDDGNDEHYLQPAKKKRKKIKALPSVCSALKSPQHSALQVLGSQHEKEKQKEEKMQQWIKSHHGHKAEQHVLDGTDKQPMQDEDKRKQALQRNKLEHAKYVKKQMKLLANAEQETKLKRSVQETTRQKNSRKQKIGQANFTLKWDRDCGFEMAGV